MGTISGLPKHHDIDADYSPQYVQLARIIRDKIESGEYKRMDAVSAAGLASSYGVSARVAYASLAMLAANKYISLVRGRRSFRVTWNVECSHARRSGGVAPEKTP